MLSAKSFYEICAQQGVHFYAGVPDSLLRDLCAYLMDHVPSNRHVITANEGGAVGLAAGYYLATGEVPAVYLQNSGQGNIINPLLSLADPEVYGIPMLLLVGWRGQPGGKDEPQHMKQGQVMMDIFRATQTPCEILETEGTAVGVQVERLVALARKKCCPVALVVQKGSFEKYQMTSSRNLVQTLSRESVIRQIVQQLPRSAAVISTTGHISRELYECRLAQKEGHERDFLTVGSMGHASQIALGIAMAQPERKVYCLDGDGAVLMHMGAMPIIGQSKCRNLRHIVLNNGAHVSVGGQLTVALSISLKKIASACGYEWSASVDSPEGLGQELKQMAMAEGPAFLETKISQSARSDLLRPKSSPAENKDAFMQFLQSSDISSS